MAARLLILAAAAALLAGGAAASGLEAAAGRALFTRNWVSPGASVPTTTGLGPHYSARACSACHDGGRAGALAVDAGLTVRLADSRGRPDPVDGRQLHSRAAAGAAPEARVQLAWATAVEGRRPVLSLGEWAAGPLAPGMHAGLRRAPSLRGLAALEAVPAAEVLRRAGGSAPKPDGVSGRPSLIAVAGGRRLGRWGWKATQSDLQTQVAVSLLRDIGVSAGVEGQTAETPAAIPAALASYLRSLPSPRPPDTRAPGHAVFRRIGCGACHTVLHTADGRPVAAYTDLLLHDMGPGLDDGAGEGTALSQEWRTAPLWTVREELARGGLLHDGRARTVAEAVRWHGGEAAPARRRFAALRPDEQSAVAAFLGGW